MNPAPPTNLRPYGTPVVGSLEHPVWPADYKDAAAQRANYKRSVADPDMPLGRDTRLAVNFALTGSITLLLCGSIFLSAVNSSGPPPGMLFAVIFIFGTVRAYQAWAESDGHTQLGAVRSWVNAIRTRRFERVDRLRLAADRDTFLRIHPGEGPGDPVPLVSPVDLQNYWTDLMTRNRLSRTQWLVTKAVVRPLAPDLGLVSFTLAVSRGSARLALLILLVVVGVVLFTFLYMTSSGHAYSMLAVAPLVLVAALVASLVLIARRRKFVMQKIVIWRNDRWRIFNGEWQGPEERDLSWLRANA